MCVSDLRGCDRTKVTKLSHFGKQDFTNGAMGGTGEGAEKATADCADECGWFFWFGDGKPR